MEKLILQQTHGAINSLCKLQEPRLKLLLIQGLEDCFHGYFLAALQKQLFQPLSGITQGAVIVSWRPSCTLFMCFVYRCIFFYCHSIFKQAGNLSFLHKLLLEVCIVHLFRSHKMFMSKGTVC